MSKELIAITKAWRMKGGKVAVSDICHSFRKRLGEGCGDARDAMNCYNKIKTRMDKEGIEPFVEFRISFGDRGASVICIGEEDAIKLIFRFRGSKAEAARTLFANIIRNYFRGGPAASQSSTPSTSTVYLEPDDSSSSGDDEANNGADTSKRLHSDAMDAMLEEQTKRAKVAEQASKWKAAMDPRRERMYYWNTETRVAVWEGTAAAHDLEAEHANLAEAADSHRPGTLSFFRKFAKQANDDKVRAKQLHKDFAKQHAEYQQVMKATLGFDVPDLPLTSQAIVDAIDERVNDVKKHTVTIAKAQASIVAMHQKMAKNSCNNAIVQQ